MNYPTINNEVKTLLDILNKNGYEAYLVGGAVRDFYLNKKVTDFDVTTNATPEINKKLFSNYKIIDTGIKHGTITIIINHINIEVTTYRTENNYINNRHPDSVRFINDINDDLSRRDFTINALAYNNKLIDNYNGLEDIKNKVIRAIGNPKIRFEEDALRILRAIRFSSILEFSIDELTSNAILDSYRLIDNISKERITNELYKTIMGNFELVFDKYFIIFKYLIKGLKNYKDFSKEIMKRNYLSSRFAYLIKDINYNEVLKELKCSKAFIKDINNILKNKDLYIIDDIKEMQKLLINNSYKDLVNILDYKQRNDCINTLDEALNKIHSIRELDINGDDLLKIGINKTKIKQILNEVLIKVIDDELINNRTNIIEYIKSKV